MRYLRSTVKWEMRKWKEYVLPYLLAVLVVWLILWALAGTTLALGLGILTGFVGLYMITIYPTMSVVGFEFTTKNLPEHGSGRPFAVVLAVRMIIVVITCLVGFMIFSVTFYFLASLGWDFAVPMASTSRCVFGVYVACRDYREDLCICTRLSPFAFVAWNLIIMELIAMVVFFPGAILYAVVSVTAAGRGKAIWPYALLFYMWSVAGFVGGPVWGLVTGNQILGFSLVMFIIFPIVFLILSCPLVDRHSDKISVSQIGQGTWWGFK